MRPVMHKLRTHHLRQSTPACGLWVTCVNCLVRMSRPTRPPARRRPRGPSRGADRPLKIPIAPAISAGSCGPAVMLVLVHIIEREFDYVPRRSRSTRSPFPARSWRPPTVRHPLLPPAPRPAPVAPSRRSSPARTRAGRHPYLKPNKPYARRARTRRRGNCRVPREALTALRCHPIRLTR